MTRLAVLELKLGFVVYDEIFTAVTDSLRAAGASVRQVMSAQDASPVNDDALLIIGAPGFYSTLLTDLTALRAAHGQAVRVLLWQLEHLPDPEMPAAVVWAHAAKSLLRAARHGGRLDTMRGASFLLLRQMARRGLVDNVLTLSERGAQFLLKQGIAARCLPLGHHPLWGVNTHGARDIDVLFLGEVLHDRRSRIVRAVRDELARDGVTLQTMYDFNPVGVWGAERNALLGRTKVYLSVYRHPSAASGLRLSLGMGNGALVVSEPVADAAPFVAGTHFVEAPVPALAQAVRDVLRDERRREQIVSAATAVLETEYSMTHSAQVILALARGETSQTW